MMYLLALLTGVVAGLRTLVPLAAISWAANVGWLDLNGTALAFMGYSATAWVFTVLAVLELVLDKAPNTPNRTVIMAFVPRLLAGGLAGAACGALIQSMALGAVAGVVGAIIGTVGGLLLRQRLAAAFKRDLPAALIEDAIAIGGILLILIAAR